MTTKGNKKGFSTRAVHSGRGFVGNTGAVMPPVYLTSTFAQGNADGFDYTRSGNPNFRLLEQSIATLEGAEHATCFASGVSAITAVVSSLKSGDLIVAEENIYGCTYRMFERVFAKFGVQARYFDLSRSENWPQISALKPALVWLESPTNPLLKILDIAGISALGAPVVVDNTFASPFYSGHSNSARRCRFRRRRNTSTVTAIVSVESSPRTMRLGTNGWCLRKKRSDSSRRRSTLG